MITVLVDGRIDAHDGIGRYTRGLIGALHTHKPSGLRINVLPPGGAPRYSRGEGADLSRVAHAAGADVVHVLDYRVPLDDTGIPLVTTIHDVLRITHPEHCYGDGEFAARFGADGLAELAATTSALRQLADPPPGAVRERQSLHEEFYARMLALACARSRWIVTPTHAVSRQLVAAVGAVSRLRVSPWGVDHDGIADIQLPSRQSQALQVARPYVLYVGQARSHKGLSTLIDSFERSHSRRAGVQLVCVGQDFAAGERATALAVERLGGAVVTVGAIDDAALGTLYANASLLVHLAEHEGFGFTPLEAMSFGARVVASDIPVLRETLECHADFVDHTDATAVAQAIDRIISAPDEAAHRSRRIQWARQYRWDRHARDVLACYAGAVA